MASWTAFLRSLRARGLSGVHLVASDAHEGLKGAIAAALLGAAWQRCPVHFLRNVLAHIPRGAAEMVLAAIRTIFAQPEAAAVREQLEEVARKAEPRFPAVAAILTEAREEVTAFAVFPFSQSGPAARKCMTRPLTSTVAPRSDDSPTGSACWIPFSPPSALGSPGD